MLSRYFEEMKLVVERHGGVVEKFIGDAVMAVFGIPRSTRTTRCAPSGRQPRCERRSPSLNEEFAALLGRHARRPHRA